MKILKTLNLVVVNSKGFKICLLKRNSDDFLLRKWSCPGQSIKKEESEEVALRRILKEELGVEGENFKYLFKTENTTKNSVIKSKYYSVVVKDPISIDSRKYSEYSWERIDEELFLLDYAFDQKEVISKFLSIYEKK